MCDAKKQHSIIFPFFHVKWPIMSLTLCGLTSSTHQPERPRPRLSGSIHEAAHPFLIFCRPFLQMLRLGASTMCCYSLFHLVNNLFEKNISNNPECTAFWLVLMSDLLFLCYFYQLQTNLGAPILTVSVTSEKLLSNPVYFFFPPMTISLNTLIFLHIPVHS